MSMKKVLIGISGKKGSGKDYTCRRIQEEVGHGKKFAYADPIKQIASDYFGVPLEISNASQDVKENTKTDWLWEEIPSNYFTGDMRQYPEDYPKPPSKNGKTGPMSVRDLLQWIGTEVFRNNMHTDFWVKCTIGRILRHKGYFKVDISDKEEKTENLYIITDVRFPNEAKAIQEQGGVVIRIKDDFLPNKDEHPSERALDSEDKPSEVSVFTDSETFGEWRKPMGQDSRREYSALWKVKKGSMFDYFIRNEVKDKDVLRRIVKDLVTDLRQNRNYNI